MIGDVCFFMVTQYRYRVYELGVNTRKVCLVPLGL